MEAAWARLHTITGAETPEEVIAYFEGDTATMCACTNMMTQSPSLSPRLPVKCHLYSCTCRRSRTAVKPKVPPNASYVVGDRARTGIPACVLSGLKKADECRPKEQGGKHDGAGAAGRVRGETRQGGNVCPAGEAQRHAGGHDRHVRIPPAFYLPIAQHSSNFQQPAPLLLPFPPLSRLLKTRLLYC